jgi:hypothetical protein
LQLQFLGVHLLVNSFSLLLCILSLTL